jgi:steroid delta-isomerase-like uncharacterized protein
MDDPKHLVNRFVEELWNERRLDVADTIFAKDCVTHQLRSGVPTDAVRRGPHAIKEHVAGWIASFPDLRFSIEQMLSEGDRVVTQLLMEGTHQGAWLGIPGSGKKMQIRMFTVHRVERGKIVEDWCWWNRSASFSNLELSRTRQTWSAISCVSKVIDTRRGC